MISNDSENITPKYLFNLHVFALWFFLFCLSLELDCVRGGLVAGLFLDAIYISNAAFNFSGFQWEQRRPGLFKDLHMNQQESAKKHSFLFVNETFSYLLQSCRRLRKVKPHFLWPGLLRTNTKTFARYESRKRIHALTDVCPPVKHEQRTAFFGEDIYIDFPKGTVGEVVFHPKNNQSVEVVLLRDGKVEDPRVTITAPGHLILEDVQKKDEGVYVIRDSSKSGATRQLHLHVKGNKSLLPP